MLKNRALGEGKAFATHTKKSVKNALTRRKIVFAAARTRFSERDLSNKAPLLYQSKRLFRAGRITPCPVRPNRECESIRFRLRPDRRIARFYFCECDLTLAPIG